MDGGGFSSPPGGPQWAMKPIVIAHRGASGYRPEHTLAAYRLAIEQGADFIEPDLVPTRDGVLVARHENELSGSTDVAAHPEFADRRCRKRIDGVQYEGWFCEDFLLRELRTLRAREPRAALRPGSAAFDGQFGIPTLAEILALLREAQANGRRVGLYPETKHPTWFAHEGWHLGGGKIGLSLGRLLVDELVANGFTQPDRVFIQSFELANLIELKRTLMPAAGVAFPLVQLLGDLDAPGPYDVAWHAAQGDDLRRIYGEGADVVAARGQGPLHFRDLVRPDALAWLRQSHAAALGPSKASLLAPASEESAATWLAQAFAAGLQVHPYTLRAEFDAQRELPRLLAMGVQGFFIDQPDLGVALREAPLAQAPRT